MELDPANPRHGRMLADLLNVQTGRQAEALAQSLENVRRFPRDALSRYDLARHYKDQGRYEEFDRELDAVLALTPLPNAIAWKARLQFGLHNDFPGMKRWLDQVPERVRGTERTVFGYFLYAAFGGDTETGLEALRAFTQKWFTDFEYAGPTALLNADLLVRQGKGELARQQYEAAWLEIQRMRTTEPARIWLNHAEFWTLLGLDRKAEARLAFRRLLEAQRRPYAQSLFTGWWFTLIPGALLIGEQDTALELMRECVATLPEVRGAIRLRMQLDPRMAPFRDDPDIQALLAEPEPKAQSILPEAGRRASIDQKSVAVLAFANLSDDKANEYFSDGISEELLNVLAKVPGLKVSARTSAFYFKGKEVPVPEIAKQLGVAYVVEGSVRKAGDKVRITAQLVKAADGFHVWSDTFTRKDVFAVQDEIAGLIAKNLSLKMGMTSSSETLDAEVLPLYYAALQAWNLRTIEGMDRAEALLNRALGLAPNFARGHAALAKVWAIRGELTDTLSPFGMRDGPLARTIREKVDQALALDPLSAEAYGALGVLSWDTWRTDEAAVALRRATELNPNYASAHQWLGRVLSSQGHLDEGIASLQRAVEVDPLSQRILDNCGRLLYLADRPREALAMAERALVIQPSAIQAQALKAQALFALGQAGEAVRIARTLPSNLAIVTIQKVQVLADAGHLGEVEQMLPQLTGANLLAKVGALIALGRKDAALSALDPNWFSANRADVLLFDHLLDPVRREPAFLRLLDQLGLREAHQRAQAWRAAHPPEKPAGKK
jgi:TolB-like protein/Flp pilus assembly protein TadD